MVSSRTVQVRDSTSEVAPLGGGGVSAESEPPAASAARKPPQHLKSHAGCAWASTIVSFIAVGGFRLSVTQSQRVVLARDHPLVRGSRDHRLVRGCRESAVQVSAYALLEGHGVGLGPFGEGWLERGAGLLAGPADGIVVQVGVALGHFNAGVA